MREVIRGATVMFFDIQFMDVNKNATVPESALLRVRYTRCGCEKFDDITLRQSGGVWSGEWNSSPADPGTIYWWIKSVAPDAVATEGAFRLNANPANERGEVDG